MFGVLYDPCNLMQAGTDYRRALSEFGPHITHVHFKHGRPSADGTWERCGLGQGVIDFTWLISELETLGYTGDYAVEFELNGGGGADKMAQAGADGRVAALAADVRADGGQESDGGSAVRTKVSRRA